MNIIETQDLKIRYGRAEALRGLNLSVADGSVCALVGANGAGKTTAIKVLMNLLRPSSGTARVLGVESRLLTPSQFERIGYVSENQDLPKWMTVRQLLDFCRPFYPAWELELERQLLKVLELPEDRPLKGLSRGMLMKASLVSSLAYRPQLLVLDEPFTGLDVVVREEFVQGLLEVIGAGEWTVLISSHDMEEVERLADTIAYLEEGRLRFSESTESLVGRFRRIEGPVGEDVAGPKAGALGWRRDGAYIQYIEPAFTAASLGTLSPDLRATPMSLREIMVALIRESRDGKGKDSK
jgi:ABC-2 type transport system ATP-binding protein